MSDAHRHSQAEPSKSARTVFQKDKHYNIQIFGWSCIAVLAVYHGWWINAVFGVLIAVFKVSDLAKIPGVSKQRGALFTSAGFTTGTVIVLASTFLYPTDSLSYAAFVLAITIVITSEVIAYVHDDEQPRDDQQSTLTAYTD